MPARLALHAVKFVYELPRRGFLCSEAEQKYMILFLSSRSDERSERSFSGDDNQIHLIHLDIDSD